MRTLRIYSDASVIGGCLDEEFSEHSLRFIERVKSGRLVLPVSELLIEELTGAPPAVRAILEALPVEQLENVVIDQ